MKTTTDWFWRRPSWLTTPKLPNALIQNALQIKNREDELVIALGVKDLRVAMAEALADELRSSFRIEGEELNSGRLRSSIARKLHLECPDWEKTVQSRSRNENRAVQAALVLLESSEKISSETLLKTHAILGDGKDWGKFRTEDECVYAEDGLVVYEAPPPERVADLVEKFCLWWNNERPSLPTPIGAALGHYFFVAIHPFVDGNGRMARMLSDKALVQKPEETFRPYSVSAALLHGRERYYQTLDKVKDQKGLLDFISFMLHAQQSAIESAFHRARQLSSFRTFLDEFEEEFSEAEIQILRTITLGERKHWDSFSATCEMEDGEAAFEAWHSLVDKGVIQNGSVDLALAADAIRNSRFPIPGP